jgi:hypothetical protein
MLKKVLATCRGHEITAQFLDEDEYNRYCKKVMSASLDIALKSLSLDEIIDLWQKKNGDSADEIAESVGVVAAAGR